MAKPTTKVVNNNDRHSTAVAALAAVVSGKEGFEVSIFSKLDLYREEDGTYSVYERNAEKNEQTSFEDPLQAAGFFLKRREEMELGLDFEG
jgi:hypothetical protein